MYIFGYVDGDFAMMPPPAVVGSLWVLCERAIIGTSGYTRVHALLNNAKRMRRGSRYISVRSCARGVNVTYELCNASSDYLMADPIAHSRSFYINRDFVRSPSHGNQHVHHVSRWLYLCRLFLGSVGCSASVMLLKPWTFLHSSSYEMYENKTLETSYYNAIITAFPISITILINKVISQTMKLWR